MWIVDDERWEKRCISFIISRSRKKTDWTLGLESTPVNVVRNLGVILDENMTMSDNIARNWFIGSRGLWWLIPNLFWFFLLCIADWTTIIVSCICYLGCICSYCSLCWTLQPVWFEVWSVLITYHQSWLNCIGFLTRSMSNIKFAHLCSSVLKVSLRLTLLLFAPRVRQSLVSRLWDPLFVGIMLCLAIGRIGVWEPLLLLVQAVGMSCLLNWWIRQSVLQLLRNTWRRICSELVFSDLAYTFEFV